MSTQVLVCRHLALGVATVDPATMSMAQEMDSNTENAWRDFLDRVVDPSQRPLAERVFEAAWARRLYPLQSHLRLVLSVEPPMAGLVWPSVALIPRDASVQVDYFVRGIVDREKTKTFAQDEWDGLETSIRGWLHPAWSNRAAREVWTLATEDPSMEPALERLARDCRGIGLAIVARQVFDLPLSKVKELVVGWANDGGSPGRSTAQMAAEFGSLLREHLRDRVLQREWTLDNGGWRSVG
jgi:hypothetical protein